jgi:hypothetical protein
MMSSRDFTRERDALKSLIGREVIREEDEEADDQDNTGSEFDKSEVGGLGVNV